MATTNRVNLISLYQIPIRRFGPRQHGFVQLTRFLKVKRVECGRPHLLRRFRSTRGANISFGPPTCLFTEISNKYREMAPLEGITSAKVYQMAGILLAVTSLWLGLESLYRGLTQSPPDVLLGVDTNILWGVYWILAALFWAFLYRRLVRREATASE